MGRFPLSAGSTFIHNVSQLILKYYCFSLPEISSHLETILVRKVHCIPLLVSSILCQSILAGCESDHPFTPQGVLYNPGTLCSTTALFLTWILVRSDYVQHKPPEDCSACDIIKQKCPQIQVCDVSFHETTWSHTSFQNYMFSFCHKSKSLGFCSFFFSFRII